MTTDNAVLLTDLVLNLLQRAATIGATITQARAEGRDVTAAEVDAAAAEDDKARTALDNAINAVQR